MLQKHRTKHNFNPNLTTEKKVLEALQFINISKAAGIDKISGRFLEDGANILAKPIAKTLYKTGSKTNSENFRPISLLPLISKFIQRIVYDQIDNYFLQNNILYNYQSGFRKNHSTNLCLSFLN